MVKFSFSPSNPHRSSQSLTLQTQIHSNPNTGPQSLTLQTLTLTQTLRHATAQPHRSSNSHSHSLNLTPLLNLNLKVGTLSQYACFD